jgi:hypothetical protein
MGVFHTINYIQQDGKPIDKGWLAGVKNKKSAAKAVWVFAADK